MGELRDWIDSRFAEEREAHSAACHSAADRLESVGKLEDSATLLVFLVVALSIISAVGVFLCILDLIGPTGSEAWVNYAGAAFFTVIIALVVWPVVGVAAWLLWLFLLPLLWIGSLMLALCARAVRSRATEWNPPSYTSRTTRGIEAVDSKLAKLVPLERSIYDAACRLGIQFAANYRETIISHAKPLDSLPSRIGDLARESRDLLNEAREDCDRLEQSAERYEYILTHFNEANTLAQLSCDPSCIEMASMLRVQLEQVKEYLVRKEWDEFDVAIMDYDKVIDALADNARHARQSDDTDRQDESHEEPEPESDPYVVLGVAPWASYDEIRSAYRRMSKALHPDKLAGYSDDETSYAEERMKLITAAYEQAKAKAQREAAR